MVGSFNEVLERRPFITKLYQPLYGMMYCGNFLCKSRCSVLVAGNKKITSRTLMLKKMKVIMGISSFILMFFSMMVITSIVMMMRSFGMGFLVMMVRYHTMGEHNSIS
jgi:hypothetical protein